MHHVYLQKIIMVSFYKNLPIIYVSHVLVVVSMLKSFPVSRWVGKAMTLSHPGPGGCLFEVLVEDEPPKAHATPVAAQRVARREETTGSLDLFWW